MDRLPVPSDRLYRFGLEWESRQQLAEQAAAAKRHGLPHGSSAFSRSSRSDVVFATRTAIEAEFVVHKTAKNPYQYIIELPEPVTEHVADAFNRLFGRSRS